MILRKKHPEKFKTDVLVALKGLKTEAEIISEREVHPTKAPHE